MRPTRIVVLVPGFLGSSLWYQMDDRTKKFFWTDDMLQNYKLLRKNPDLLTYKFPTHSAFIEEIYTNNVPFIRHAGKVKIWNKMLEMLRSRDDISEDFILRFSYDWRKCIISSALSLGGFLEKKLEDLLEMKCKLCNPPDGVPTRLVLIGHSMGGLLIRACIAEKLVHPAWLDKVFFIGSPLQGAPSTIRNIYDKVRLPLINIWLGYNRVHADDYIAAFRKCLQSFDSVFQMLPHDGCSYIHLEDRPIGNLLDDNILGDDHIDKIRNVHEKIRLGGRILADAKVPNYAIHTARSEIDPTELLYKVRMNGDQYDDVVLLSDTHQGDGTVPAWSAVAGADHVIPFQDIEHAKMCSNQEIVDSVALHLNDVEFTGEFGIVAPG